MKHLGDFDTSAVIYGKFTTYRPSTGAAFTLAGTPAISVYKDNSATQSTTGVTLTADFDSVTGLNHFAIDTSADGTFYSAGSFFEIVITTGTVDSVSVVGSVVAGFTLRKNSALKPATAGRTLVVDASGLADANMVKSGPTGSGTAQTARDLGASVLVAGDFSATMKTSIGTAVAASAVASVTGNVGGNVTGQVGSVASGGITEASFATTAGGFKPLGIVDQGTAQAATGTTLQLRSAAAFADDELIGAVILINTATTGAGQARVITDYVGSTDTATVDTWTTTPTGAITYKVFGAPPGSATAPIPASLDATQFAKFFSVDSGTVYGSAVAGSVVKEIADNAGGSSLTVGAIADGVWDELLSGHAISGSAGAGLSAAGSAGDPWSTALPGAYGSGTAGKIIGDNINATISSRASPTNITAGTITTVTNLTNAPTAGDFTAAMKTSIGTAVAASAVASVTGNVGGNVTGSVGSVVGAVGSVTGAVGSVTGLTASNLDATVSSRLASAGYTAPDNTSITAIKAKTDNLPSGIQKNTALNNFEFLMVLTSDHYTAGTGLTITAQRSLDGAAFSACANSATEVSNGVYKINLAAGDLNANIVTLLFTATGADARVITLATEP